MNHIEHAEDLGVAELVENLVDPGEGSDVLDRLPVECAVVDAQAKTAVLLGGKDNAGAVGGG